MKVSFPSLLHPTPPLQAAEPVHSHQNNLYFSVPRTLPVIMRLVSRGRCRYPDCECGACLVSDSQGNLTEVNTTSSLGKSAKTHASSIAACRQCRAELRGLWPWLLYSCHTTRRRVHLASAWWNLKRWHLGPLCRFLTCRCT